MKMCKRILSVVLSICMVVAVVPLTPASAENDSLPPEYSGACSDTVFWKINTEKGVLTVSGSGEIPDYTSCYSTPWFAYYEIVKTIIIKGDITRIGNYAFSNMVRVASASIQADVVEIGQGAFEHTQALQKIYIPVSCTYMDFIAFNYCYSLTDVYYGGNEEQFNAIKKYAVGIGGFDEFLAATRHYNTFFEGYEDDFVLEPGDYEVKMYAHIPTMVLGKGMAMEAMLQLLKDGVPYKHNGDFIFTVSDNEIATITNVHDTEEAVSCMINAHNEGAAMITMVEVNTGAIYSTMIQVVAGIQTFNAAALPSYYDRDFEYNAHVGGMYIDEFVAVPIDLSYQRVTFNVYNSTCRAGVVEIYDAENNLYDTAPIERYDGGFVTSLSDTLWSGCRLLEDLSAGELLTYKQESYSKKTPISIKVPVGGHIKITNDMYSSDACAILNIAELATTVSLLVAKSVSNIGDAKPVAQEVGEKTLRECALEEIPMLGKKFRETLSKDLVKQATEDGFIAALQNNARLGLDVFELSDEDFARMVVSTAKDVGIGVAEDAFLEYLGFAGDTLEGMFSFSKYCDLCSFVVQLITPHDDCTLTVHFNGADGYLTNNGVSIKSSDAKTDLTQKNFVMHSVVLSKDTDLSGQLKESLDSISEKYVVRNISLQKDGNTCNPDGNVRVDMPIPSDYNPNKCMIFWVDDDGTLTKMPHTIEGNRIYFDTNHFSYYMLIEVEDDTLRGVISNNLNLRVAFSAKGDAVYYSVDSSLFNGQGYTDPYMIIKQGETEMILDEYTVDADQHVFQFVPENTSGIVSATVYAKYNENIYAGKERTIFLSEEKGCMLLDNVLSLKTGELLSEEGFTFSAKGLSAYENGYVSNDKKGWYAFPQTETDIVEALEEKFHFYYNRENVYGQRDIFDNGDTTDVYGGNEDVSTGASRWVLLYDRWLQRFTQKTEGEIFRKIDSLVPLDSTGNEIKAKNFETTYDIRFESETQGAVILGFRQQTPGLFTTDWWQISKEQAFVAIGRSGITISGGDDIVSKKDTKRDMYNRWQTATFEEILPQEVTVKVKAVDNICQVDIYRCSDKQLLFSYSEEITYLETGYVAYGVSTVGHDIGNITWRSLDTNYKDGELLYDNGAVCVGIEETDKGNKYTFQIEPDEGYELKAGSLYIVDKNGNAYVPTRVNFRNGGDGNQYTVTLSDEATVYAEFFKPTVSEPNVGWVGVSIHEENRGLRYIHRVNATEKNGERYMTFGDETVKVKDYGLLIAAEPVLGDSELTVDLSKKNSYVKKYSAIQTGKYFDVCSDYIDIAVQITNIPQSAANLNIYTRVYMELESGEIVYGAVAKDNYANASGLG